MSTGTVNLHRVLKAPVERVYRAFLNAEALAKWNAPHGFTATIHELDARLGGRFKISFNNFSTGSSHSFGGTYVEMDANKKLKFSDQFDDPNLPGTMYTTVTFNEVFCGTELHITQEGIPAMIPLAACYLGWQESLSLLAQLVEAQVPDQ